MKRANSKASGNSKGSESFFPTSLRWSITSFLSSSESPLRYSSNRRTRFSRFSEPSSHDTVFKGDEPRKSHPDSVPNSRRRADLLERHRSLAKRQTRRTEVNGRNSFFFLNTYVALYRRLLSQRPDVFPTPKDSFPFSVGIPPLLIVSTFFFIVVTLLLFTGRRISVDGGRTSVWVMFNHSPCARNARSRSFLLVVAFAFLFRRHLVVHSKSNITFSLAFLLISIGHSILLRALAFP